MVDKLSTWLCYSMPYIILRRKKSCIIFALEKLDWSLFCDHISSSTIECWKWCFRIFCLILFWVTNLIFFTCLHEKFLQYVFFSAICNLVIFFFLRFYNRHHHITQKKLLSHSTVIVLRFFLVCPCVVFFAVVVIAIFIVTQKARCSSNKK